MERVKEYFKSLAEKHHLLRHREYEPHFAYLNDEMSMLLPAQMGYPFVLLSHSGWQVVGDDSRRSWNIILSVLDHVSDTGDELEKNRAVARCQHILDDLLARATGFEAKVDTRWLRGIDLDDAQGMMIENEADALYGWAVTFSISLPWCHEVKSCSWDDLRILDDV